MREHYETYLDNMKRKELVAFSKKILSPFQGWTGLLHHCPRASLADSLCPGLISFGPLALKVGIWTRYHAS